MGGELEHSPQTVREEVNLNASQMSFNFRDVSKCGMFIVGLMSESDGPVSIKFASRCIRLSTATVPNGFRSSSCWDWAGGGDGVTENTELASQAAGVRPSSRTTLFPHMRGFWKSVSVGQNEFQFSFVLTCQGSLRLPGVGGSAAVGAPGATRSSAPQWLVG